MWSDISFINLFTQGFNIFLAPVYSKGIIETGQRLRLCICLVFVSSILVTVIYFSGTNFEILVNAAALGTMDQSSAIFLFRFSDTLLSKGSLKLNSSGSSNGSKTSGKSPFLGRLNEICCNGTGCVFLLDTLA